MRRCRSAGSGCSTPGPVPSDVIGSARVCAFPIGRRNPTVVGALGDEPHQVTAPFEAEPTSLAYFASAPLA